MKKTIFTLCLLAFMQHVFAGPAFHPAWQNYTQNTGASPTGSLAVYLTANMGDSVRFGLLVDCGGSYTGSDQWLQDGDTIASAAGAFNIYEIINQSGTFTADFVFCLYHLNVNFYVTANNTTGTEHFQNFIFLNVHPTTVTSSIIIQLHSIKPNDIEISFFDINGRQLKKDFYKNISGEFIKNENTEALSNGIYFIKIKAGDEMLQKKFVKM